MASTARVFPLSVKAPLCGSYKRQVTVVILRPFLGERTIASTSQMLKNKRKYLQCNRKMRNCVCVCNVCVCNASSPLVNLVCRSLWSRWPTTRIDQKINIAITICEHTICENQPAVNKYTAFQFNFPREQRCHCVNSSRCTLNPQIHIFTYLFWLNYCSLGCLCDFKSKYDF